MECPNCGYDIFDDQEKKIEVVELTQTCGGCPSQWEGRTNYADDVYVRYRWGTLTININNKTILSLNHGSNMDGVMSESELKELTKYLIEWPF